MMMVKGVALCIQSAFLSLSFRQLGSSPWLFLTHSFM